VHAAAAVLVRDGYKVLVRPDLDPLREARLIRVLVVVISAVAYYFAVVSKVSLVALLLLSYGFIAQIAPVLLATFLFRRATTAGVLSGLVTGCATVVLLNLRPELQAWDVHPGIWGLAVNLAALALVSRWTTPLPEEHVREFVEA